MKKFILLSLLLPFNILFTQGQKSTSAFENFGCGIYGGINIGVNSKTGGTFLVDIKTSLISNLNMNFSLSYSKTFVNDFYTVKTYSVSTVNGTSFFYANQYNVNEKGYDIIPLFLGIQYVFKQSTFSPYLLFNAGYNFIIDTKYYRSPILSTPYPSLEDIPNEFKIKHVETAVNNSLGIMVGFGTIYHLFSKIDFDFRYIYKYDTEIINTHQIIFGITF